MSIHLLREIETLKRKILSLSAVVENNVRLAVRSVAERDADLARRVIEADREVDQTEVEIEESCLKILALYQPVAQDLRFIVAVLKINNDLERIGDLAVNVAERAAFLATQPPPELAFDLPAMADKTRTMLKRSLDALLNMDPALAQTVCASDEEVDALNREMYARVNAAVHTRPAALDALNHLLGVSRHLERIADLATNIAEDVIYMVEARIVRHHVEDYAAEADRRARPTD